MVNIQQLDSTDIRYICSQIPPDIVRKYFKNHPKAFNEIKPGFRAESLSNDSVISILCNNINHPFISSFVNEGTTGWIEDVESYIEQLIGEGKTRNEAMLIALSHKNFMGNPGVYFKLTNRDCNEEYISLVEDAMTMLCSSYKDEKDKTIEDTEIKSETVEDKEHDDEQVALLQEEKEKIEKKLDEAQNELKRTQKQLIELSEELINEKEKTEEMKQELDHYKYLEKYSDSMPEENIDTKYQYLSIGSVYHNTKGERKLVRLADIEHGEIKAFECNYNIPRKFANRDKLFVSDGPDKDDYIGTWRWSADKNQREPENDYITSEYVARYIPTMIIELLNCHSLKDIIVCLKDGINDIGVTGKTLFVYTSSDGEKEGVLCTLSQMKQVGAKYQLLPSVFVLPSYKFSDESIITIDSFRFYKYLALGTPQGITRVRLPYEAVKDMVITRATNAVLRSNGLTNKEAQHCQQFIKELPTNTMQEELVDAYGCSNEEAGEFINGFIDHAVSYLDKADIDTTILGCAISRVPELVDVCKGEIKTIWEKENEKMLLEAEEEMRKKQEEITTLEQELRKCERAIHEAQEQKDQIEKEIKEKEVLAKEVKLKVAKKIEEAKENAAEFISQMAFIPASTVQVSETSAESSPGFIVNMIEEEYEKGQDILDLNSFEEELAENFNSVGYDNIIAVNMANILCYSICNNMPVIIGDNSSLMATCISAMFGQNAVEIDIPLTGVDINKLKKYIIEQNGLGQKVFLIKGVFDGYNTNVFTAMVSFIRNLKDAIVLLSLEGNCVEMLPQYVWSNSLYVDGDLGLNNLRSGTIKSFLSDVEFIKTFDESDYKIKKKELMEFRQFLSNNAIRYYSGYLSSYSEDCLSSLAILTQLIVHAKSKGLKTELVSALQNYEISSNIQKIINQLM